VKNPFAELSDSFGGTKSFDPHAINYAENETNSAYSSKSASPTKDKVTEMDQVARQQRDYELKLEKLQALSDDHDGRSRTPPSER
jgi:hypothetical protein